jgi:uncharacterized protein (DUF4415 family)
MPKPFDPDHAAKHGYTEADWNADDNPEWTEEDFRNAKRAVDIPALAHLARRGRPKLPPQTRKARLSMVVDPEVLNYFRATGKGWQTRLNLALKEWIATR